MEQDPKHPEYEPPEVEQVLEADDLAREVHYAGSPDPSRVGSIG